MMDRADVDGGPMDGQLEAQKIYCEIPSSCSPKFGVFKYNCILHVADDVNFKGESSAREVRSGRSAGRSIVNGLGIRNESRNQEWRHQPFFILNPSPRFRSA